MLVLLMLLVCGFAGASIYRIRTTVSGYAAYPRIPDTAR